MGRQELQRGDGRAEGDGRWLNRISRCSTSLKRAPLGWGLFLMMVMLPCEQVQDGRDFRMYVAVRGMLMRSPLGEALGSDGIFNSLDMAVRHYQEKSAAQTV